MIFMRYFLFHWNPEFVGAAKETSAGWRSDRAFLSSGGRTPVDGSATADSRSAYDAACQFLRSVLKMKKYCRAVLLVLALQMAWIGSVGALPDTSQPATISAQPPDGPPIGDDDYARLP
jgi:hypothetical protein